MKWNLPSPGPKDKENVMYLFRNPEKQQDRGKVTKSEGGFTPCRHLMPSSHFYVQSYGLLRFGHTWGVVVNRGRNRRVYLVMRN